MLRCLLASAALAVLLGPALACSNDRPAAAAGRGGGSARGSGDRGGDREGGKPAGAGQPRKVRISRSELGRLERTVPLSGTLAADEEVELAVKVSGRLASIAVDLGSPVRRGQAIARISPEDYELRVAQAESALAQARARLGLPAAGPDRVVDPAETGVVKQAAAMLKEAQLNRARSQRLFEQELIPRADLDTIEATLSVAEARLQDAVEEARNRQGLLSQRRSELGIARKQLADTVLTVPFDGLIRERLVSPGDYVAAGQPIAVLVKADPLRLRLSVPERDAPAVRVGQAVNLTAEGESAVHSGRIARVSPAISEDNRTLAVEAEIPNGDGSLRPGAFARAEIVTQPDTPAVLVPASAIITFAGVTKVMSVEEGKAVEKRVRLGRKAGDRVEIVEGLEAGVPVVVEPGNLVDGDPVEVAA